MRVNVRKAMEQPEARAYIAGLKEPTTITELAADIAAYAGVEVPLGVQQLAAFSRVLRKMIEGGEVMGELSRPQGKNKDLTFYPPGAAPPPRRPPRASRRPRGPAAEGSLEERFRKALGDLEACRRGLLNLYDEVMMKDAEIARLNAIKVPQLGTRERAALRRAGINDAWRKEHAGNDS